jgi:hypothetical protein
MAQARRHHQVPQFYLRGFADARERVKVVRFGEKARTFVAAVKNVAVEADFYKADWLDTDQEDLAEKLIGDVEQAAAEPLRMLARQEGLTNEQRYAVASWVVLQYVRGRGKRMDSVGLQKVLLRADLALRGKRHLESQFGLEEADAEAMWERVVVRGDLSDPPTARRQHLQTMFRTVAEVAGAYAQAQWYVITFKRRRLFTSDQPICLWSEPSDDPGIGLLTADTVAVALDRNTGLIMMPGRPTNRLEALPPTTQYHQLFTTTTWLSAEEFVILHPDDELPESLPEQRPVMLGTLDLPDIQQFIEMGEGMRAHRNRWSGEHGSDPLGAQ